MTYGSFMTKKVDVALALYAGGCGGGYTEAAIILASLFSGIAADFWPGDNCDRKRFVEIWSSYADPSLGSNKISIPFLIQSLRKQGDLAKAERLESSRPRMFGTGYSTKVLIGDEVDMSEKKVFDACSDLDKKTIRSFSYGALFYRHVRCGVAHEFHLSEDAVEYPMTQRAAGVSYSNRLLAWPRVIDDAANNPFAEFVNSKPCVEPLTEDRRESIRLTYFNIQWVAQVVRSVASRLAKSPSSIEKPNKWWIEG